MGSGCCSVGRAVASNTSGPQFQSRHRRFFIRKLIYLLSTVSKRRKKEKEAGKGPLTYQTASTERWKLRVIRWFVRLESWPWRQPSIYIWAIKPMGLAAAEEEEGVGGERRISKMPCNQCDQIGWFIGLWATFQSFWQQLICPNLLNRR